MAFNVKVLLAGTANSWDMQVGVAACHLDGNDGTLLESSEPQQQSKDLRIRYLHPWTISDSNLWDENSTDKQVN